MIAHARRVPRPSPAPSRSSHGRSSPAKQRRTNGSKEHPMITETQPHMIVLHLTDALLTQLQPFMAGLDITTTSHREWADQEVYAHGHVAGYANVEQRTQRLTMRGEVYAALAARVGGALDYDVRWQPNEYEPDGFVERVRPLDLIGGTHVQADCLQCGARVLANRAEVACACGQAVTLI